MWASYAIIGAIFASLTAIFAKIGLKNIDANVATAIRSLVILVLAWSIVLGQGSLGEFKGIDKKALLWILISGLTTGMSWIFFFKALQLGNVSRVAPIDKASVALTIILSFLILREPMGWKELCGGGLVVAGVLVLIK